LEAAICYQKVDKGYQAQDAWRDLLQFAAVTRNMEEAYVVTVEYLRTLFDVIGPVRLTPSTEAYVVVDR